jgi:hypothetical protein
MAKKKKVKMKKITPGINKNLPGFDISIDPFGEIQSTYDIDSVNTFLNQNLEDKKLKKKSKKNKEEGSEGLDTVDTGNE